MIENFQQEILIFLLGMTPVSELRGAIPVGILLFNFSFFKTYLIAVLGNLLPIIPLLIFFKKLSGFLMKKYKFFDDMMNWLFERTRKKHGNHFDKWKYAPLALFIFVAIPLPMTGAWSGVLAAIIFGIPLTEAVISIFFGVATAGVLVSILTKIGAITISGVATLFL